MKANVIMTIVGLALACLIGYLVFNVAAGDPNEALCGVVSTVCFLATLIPMMGIKYESARLATNIRVFSALFFVIFLISHFCFAGFGIKVPYYVVVNGILLLIYLAAFYKMQSVRDI